MPVSWIGVVDIIGGRREGDGSKQRFPVGQSGCRRSGKTHDNCPWCGQRYTGHDRGGDSAGHNRREVERVADLAVGQRDN